MCGLHRADRWTFDNRGFTLTFGAFQASYQTGLLSTSSPSAISWIGTIQSWLLIMVGVLAGPLFDMGYYRTMLIVGNFGVVFGVFMLSLAQSYWQVFLAQGVCMGLGAGFLYVPSIALIGLSFSRKRALAQGIVMSGIAVGKRAPTPKLLNRGGSWRHCGLLTPF